MKTNYLNEVINRRMSANDIPLEDRTPELVLEITKHFGWEIILLPENERSYEMYLEGVKTFGMLLSITPTEFRTDALCKAALQQNPYVLQYIENLTDEMIESALKDNPNLYSAFEEKEIDSKSHIENLVKKYNVSEFEPILEKMPNELITYDDCLAAVRRDGYEIFNVPTELVSFQLLLEAAKENGHVIENYDEKYLTPEICSAAIGSANVAIYYSPKVFVTYEMYLSAAKEFKDIINIIPKYYLTDELIKANENAKSTLEEMFIKEN